MPKKLTKLQIGNAAERFVINEMMKIYQVGMESVDFKIKSSHPTKHYNQDHFGCFDFLINTRKNETIGIQVKCDEEGYYSPGELKKWALKVLNSNFNPDVALLIVVKNDGTVKNLLVTKTFIAASVLGEL